MGQSTGQSSGGRLRGTARFGPFKQTIRTRNAWGGAGGLSFGFSSGLTFFFRGMFRSSDHCLVLPGANRRENIMRGQPRPLVRRFETLHALPIRLQIRNAKYMRDRTDNCTQLATENHANTLVDVRMFAVEENFILLRRLRFHIT